MHHSKKKNSKISFPEGPHENVWGPTRMFPRGSAVAVDGSAWQLSTGVYVKRKNVTKCAEILFPCRLSVGRLSGRSLFCTIGTAVYGRNEVAIY